MATDRPDSRACNGIVYEQDGGGRMKADKSCMGYELERVDHPTHYQGEYECIDLMREIYGDEAVRWFCILNAYKYRFRAGKKDGNSLEQDDAKAQWYENYVMKNLSNNANTDALNIKRLIGETNDLRRYDPTADDDR